MFDAVFDGHASYDFWMERSQYYSILHVLEFCGSERYVMEAAMAIPMFDSARPDYSSLEVTTAFFANNFNKLPSLYRDAITRNGFMSSDFFMQIIDTIDWSIFVENFGMPIQLFQDYFSKLNVYVCANSYIRNDIFNMFDRDEVLKKLNIVQKLRSQRFDNYTELLPLGPACKTDEERANYVDRVVFQNRKAGVPTWGPGPECQFWYVYFLNNPKLCAVFCDNRNFLEANTPVLNWDHICHNPYMDISFLKRRRDDINLANLLQAHTSEGIMELYDDSYNKNELYRWFMRIKFPASKSDFVKNYFGNTFIYNPANIQAPALLTPALAKPEALSPEPQKPEVQESDELEVQF